MSTYVGVNGSDNVTSVGLNPARGDLYAAVENFDAPTTGKIVHFIPKPAKPPDEDFKSWEYKWVVASNGKTMELSGAPVLKDGEINIFFASTGCVVIPPATSCADGGSISLRDQDLNFIRVFNFGGPGPGAFVVNKAVFRNGQFFVIGDTLSKNLPKVNAFQSVHKGGWEGFIMALSPTGVVNFSSYLGGTGHDFMLGLAVSRTGSIYVAGQTSSKNFRLLRMH